MEQFCKEVIEKCSLDYENEQVQGMSESLYELLRKFVGSMQTLDGNDTNEHMKLDIVRVDQCGSMAEKTRITTSGIEYDYLAVVSGLTYFGYPCKTCKSKGCVQVFSDSEMKVEQKSEEVKTDFLKILIDSIKRNCTERNSTGFYDYCSIRTKTGTLKARTKYYNLPDYPCFEWMPNSRDFAGIRMCRVVEETLVECKMFNYTVSDKSLYYIKPCDRESDDAIYSPNNPNKDGYPLYSDRKPIEAGLEVEVDCHPVLELDLDIAKKHFSIDTPQRCSLFPNSGNRRCGGWRLSAYDSELSALQSTSDNHRHAYMVLKFVLEQIHDGIANKLQRIKIALSCISDEYDDVETFKLEFEKGCTNVSLNL